MKKIDNKVDENNKKEKISKRTNKKIIESKRIIKEEKKKIKIEKRNIRNKKYAKIRNTKVYNFFARIFSVFKTDRDTYSFSELFGVTLISLVVGAFACFSVFVVLSDGRNYLKISKDLGKFLDVYETLSDNYYDNIDKEKLVEDAISGMVSSVGDVYTSYADVTATEEFNELVSGVYEGIGCTIQLQEDGVKVIEVFENSPSSKAGLKANDIILKVDDIDAVETKDVEKISTYIKEESSGKITMVVSRNGEEKTIKLVRGKVETPVVSTNVYEKNGKKIGYMGISIFSSVASKQFKNKLNMLEKEGIEALVIDVRGNNGGYLTTVTDIASYLLPKGSIIYQVQKDDDKEVTRDKTGTYRDYPIAVLVDGNSASASEILAGAIKESYEGFVVGTKTYGKGTVQQVRQLSDGSMIKYTVENWLTPDGNWIDRKGIEPTNKVEFDGATYYKNPIPDNDNQLQEALNLVSE